MLRNLLRHLIHNDKLVERIADSYVMRRLAQMSVSVFFKAKAIAEEAKNEKLEKLKDLDTTKLTAAYDKFMKNLNEEMDKAKAELEQKKRMK